MAGWKLYLLVLGVMGIMSKVNADWGSITITDDTRGYKNVSLENSKIKVVFKRDPRSWGGWIGFNPYCIKSFVLKSTGDDIAGGYTARLDDDMGKSAIGKAYVNYDGAERKSVMIQYDKNEAPCAQNPVSKTTWCNENIQEIAIFPNLAVIRITYYKFNLFAVDHADWPDGWDNKRRVVYGEESWPVTVNPNDPQGRPYSNGEKNVFYRQEPADGGVLNYNGYFIFGEYLVSSGLGYGRLVPPKNCHEFKFWDDGWEIFLSGSVPTTYLFAVDGGGTEILSLGKQIADGLLTMVSPAPVDVNCNKTNNQFIRIEGNPGQGQVTIKVVPSKLGQLQGLQIHDISGKLVWEHNTPGKMSGEQTITWNKGTATTGLYVATARFKERAVGEWFLITE